MDDENYIIPITIINKQIISKVDFTNGKLISTDDSDNIFVSKWIQV